MHKILMLLILQITIISCISIWYVTFNLTNIYTQLLSFCIILWLVSELRLDFFISQMNFINVKKTIVEPGQVNYIANNALYFDVFFFFCFLTLRIREALTLRGTSNLYLNLNNL